MLKVLGWVVAVILVVAVLICGYYLLLWFRKDARRERANAKMNAQVKRMARRRALETETGFIPAIDDKTPAPSGAMRARGAAGVPTSAPVEPPTQGSAGDAVEVPEHTATAVIDAVTDTTITMDAVDDGGPAKGRGQIPTQVRRPTPYPRAHPEPVFRADGVSPEAVGVPRGDIPAPPRGRIPTTA